MTMTMKRIFLNAIAVVLTASMISCAKAEKEPDPVDPGPSEPAPTFDWSPSSGGTIVADSGYFIKAYNEVVAFKNGNNNVVDIRLSDSQSGTYTISSTSGNQLDYQVGSKTYTGTVGTVTLVNNSSKMSGSFSCSLAGGTVTAISGHFSNIPVR
jgi:hypothetical protein